MEGKREKIIATHAEFKRILTRATGAVPALRQPPARARFWSRLGWVFGLLGAVVYYGRRTGSSMASSQAWSWAIPLFIFGLILPGIDNYAHAGGFGGGYLAGRMLDPLRRETIDHMLAAVACLVLSVLSVVASVLHWLTLR